MLDEEFEQPPYEAYPPLEPEEDMDQSYYTQYPGGSNYMKQYQKGM
jgi:hypothetical protein